MVAYIVQLHLSKKKIWLHIYSVLYVIGETTLIRPVSNQGQTSLEVSKQRKYSCKILSKRFNRWLVQTYQGTTEIFINWYDGTMLKYFSDV